MPTLLSRYCGPCILTYRFSETSQTLAANLHSSSHSNALSGPSSSSSPGAITCMSARERNPRSGRPSPPRLCSSASGGHDPSGCSGSCHLIFDGFKAYQSQKVTKDYFFHEFKVLDPLCRNGKLKQMHQVISDAKAFALGAFHGLENLGLQTCRDEYNHRFNRRNMGLLVVDKL